MNELIVRLAQIVLGEDERRRRGHDPRRAPRGFRCQLCSMTPRCQCPEDPLLCETCSDDLLQIVSPLSGSER